MTTAATSEADGLRREHGAQRPHHPTPCSSGLMSWESPPSPEFGPVGSLGAGLRARRGAGRRRRRRRGGGEEEPDDGEEASPELARRPLSGQRAGLVGTRRRVGTERLVQHLVEDPAGADDAERTGERCRVDEDVAPRDGRGPAVGDRLEPLERPAQIADALGQVLLVLADHGEVGVEALQQRVEGGRVLADQAVGLARHGVDVGDQVAQVLIVGGEAGRDRVEVVDDREQLLVPAGQRRRQGVRRVDQLRDLAGALVDGRRERPEPGDDLGHLGLLALGDVGQGRHQAVERLGVRLGKQ